MKKETSEKTKLVEGEFGFAVFETECGDIVHFLSVRFKLGFGDDGAPSSPVWRRYLSTEWTPPLPWRRPCDQNMGFWVFQNSVFFFFENLNFFVSGKMSKTIHIIVNFIKIIIIIMFSIFGGRAKQLERRKVQSPSQKWEGHICQFFI